MQVRSPTPVRNAMATMIVAALAGLVAPVAAHAQYAYIPDSSVGAVSVIDTSTDTQVGSPIEIGTRPEGVAVTPDGRSV